MSGGAPLTRPTKPHRSTRRPDKRSAIRRQRLCRVARRLPDRQNPTRSTRRPDKRSAIRRQRLCRVALRLPDRQNPTAAPVGLISGAPSGVSVYVGWRSAYPTYKTPPAAPVGLISEAPSGVSVYVGWRGAWPIHETPSTGIQAKKNPLFSGF